MSEDLEQIRQQLLALEVLAKRLFEQQFTRCGGRMPADPLWDEVEEVERDEFRDLARDVQPLLAERDDQMRAVCASMDRIWAAVGVGPEVEIDELLTEVRALAAFRQRVRVSVGYSPTGMPDDETILAELDAPRERSSRQAWAAEAMRLQQVIDETVARLREEISWQKHTYRDEKDPVATGRTIGVEDALRTLVRTVEESEGVRSPGEAR